MKLQRFVVYNRNSCDVDSNSLYRHRILQVCFVVHLHSNAESNRSSEVLIGQHLESPSLHSLLLLPLNLSITALHGSRLTHIYRNTHWISNTSGEFEIKQTIYFGNTDSSQILSEYNANKVFLFCFVF